MRASASNASFVMILLNHCFNNPKYAFQSAGVKDAHRFCLAMTKGFLETEEEEEDDDDGVVEEDDVDAMA